MRLTGAAAGTLALCLGCATAPPPTPLAGVQVTADANANGGYSTALDVVFVFTAEAVKQLPDNGPDWFDQRAAKQADLATALAVAHVELPRGRSTVVDLPKGYAGAIGVYAFPNYLAARGQPRINLTPYRQAHLRLANEHIDLNGTLP